MKMVRTLLKIVVGFVFLMGCSQEPKDQNAQSENKPIEQSEAKVSAKYMHPCDLVDLNKLAEILNLDISKMRARKEKSGNDVCVVSTTELRKNGTEKDIFFLNLIINPGPANYDREIAEMLQGGSLNIPAGPDKGQTKTLKEVKEVGDRGFIYSASNFSALIFHQNNEYRYTLTLLKDVPSSDFYIGLNEDSQELEKMLLEVAKTF